MTQRGVDSLLRPSFVHLGAEVRMTAGPLSGGRASTDADMIHLVSSSGVYAGMSLEAAVIHPDEGATRSFYGRSASPDEILVRGSVENAAAAPLQNLLFRLAGGG
jgi:lipid-binding SYLF domain-containing protein